MNRVIKFRGKRVDNGEWVYGDLIQSFCDDNAYIDSNNCFDIKHILVNPPIKVDKETVGQFTGLFDKNGKEIYEGDIVNHGYENILGKFYEIGSIVFSVNDSSFGISFNSPYLNRLTRATIYKYNIEIIGNIHDNKDLLK